MHAVQYTPGCSAGCARMRTWDACVCAPLLHCTPGEQLVCDVQASFMHACMYCGHAHALSMLSTPLQVHGHVPQDVMDGVLQDIGMQMRSIAEQEGLVAPATALLPARANSIARMQAQAQTRGSASLPLPSVSEVEAAAPDADEGGDGGAGGGSGSGEAVLGPSLTRGAVPASGGMAGGGVTSPAAAGEAAAGASSSMQRLLEQFSRHSVDGE